MEVLQNPTPLQVREQFVDMITRELLGPAGGSEERVYEQNIRERYAVGLIAPANATALEDPEDEQGPLATDEPDTSEEGYADQELPNFETAEVSYSTEKTSLIPSSVGMTFGVNKDTEALKITVRWGYYERDAEEQDDQRILYWQRIPFETSVVASIDDLADGKWMPDPERPLISVRSLVREYEDAYTITLFLVNSQKEPAINKGEAWLFQPEISVEAPDLDPIFIRRRLPDGLNPTEVEDNIMRMMYRKKIEFAVGHGIAVHSELPQDRWDVAQRVRTVVIPTTEIERMEPPAIENLTIDMSELANARMGEFAALLLPLVEAYSGWINKKVDYFDQNPDDLHPFQINGINIPHTIEREWNEALKRIKAGIQLIDIDNTAAEAFRFANRAMWLQRIRSIFAAQVRQEKAPNLNDIDVPENRSWRPFQLAFILLNLPAMTDPTHPERSNNQAGKEAYADLLWFPTGGGKTEAYLGLAAYTMAVRRLQGHLGELDGTAGVAVLMRYTLRLLTLQQFQRATTLISACEVIRREKPVIWGKNPFRIGLWVGQRSSPNWTDQAAEAIKRDHGQDWHTGSSIGGSGTPVQLTNCPWCGSEINAGRNIRVETVDGGRGRTFQYCGDALGECPFSFRRSPDEGLPIVVVDEEIYRLLPDLLIATVDKFAQMPWKGETQMLFGRVSGYCPRHGYVSPEINDKTEHRARGKLPAVKLQQTSWLRPPDLIIQDELHLISGPLGTLVGLYETAVDALCSWHVDGELVRPKVIASTATIRRARDQVNNLFLRRVKVFPPSGSDADDNFFSARHSSTDSSPGRLYLGICATGTRFKTILIRVYVAAMSAAQKLLEVYGRDLADPYMTLVGYFNSMRELGGMRRVMDDAVRTRLMRMEDRGLSARFVNSFDIDELTSRKGAVEIPRILDRLDTRFETPKDGSKKRTKGKYPLDAVLATNMISVGVDVSRLGLMVVAGQPKRTAEYIQATSRVGRRYPGVVLTVYNWARPRDVSHYERFIHYHETFYQQVEALSVTPFAPRALDRGLTGVLVSYLRLFSDKYNANEGASEILDAGIDLELAKDIISERAERITSSQRTFTRVQQMIQRRIDDWKNQARNVSAKVGYQGRRDDKTVPLLKKTNEEDWTRFTCLNSLRDVEPSVSLIHVDYGMDREVDQTILEESSNE